MNSLERKILFTPSCLNNNYNRNTILEKTATAGSIEEERRPIKWREGGRDGALAKGLLAALRRSGKSIVPLGRT